LFSWRINICINWNHKWKYQKKCYS